MSSTGLGTKRRRADSIQQDDDTPRRPEKHAKPSHPRVSERACKSLRGASAITVESNDKHGRRKQEHEHYRPPSPVSSDSSASSRPLIEIYQIPPLPPTPPVILGQLLQPPTELEVLEFDQTRIRSPCPSPAWNAPYDPDFGKKVCERYRDIQKWRIEKYARSVALAFPPGRTPVQAREAWHLAQDELARQFYEDCSDSEESGSDTEYKSSSHQPHRSRGDEDSHRSTAAVT